MIDMGGVLEIRYTDADKINKPQLVKAFAHLRYTPDSVDVVLRSMMEGDSNYTGLSFTGTKEILDKFLEESKDCGVEIEVLAEPPTAEWAEKMEKAFKRHEKP